MFRLLRRLLPPGLLLCVVSALHAQYFGRNKPLYEKKHFRVVQTPHFEVYHYLENRKSLEWVSNELEMWYGHHYAVFGDSLLANGGKNPVLVYNDHPDFKQTRAIFGSIGVGTGGVTDAFKQRIVFPFAMTNQQTHHVIGHEMVHAFQYNLVLYGDSTNIQNLANLPLWMTEGLAEYLSIGRYDPFTALWMREAVQRDKLPELKKMDRPEYFPYRWGHAFWAFVTSVYGDTIIRPLYENTALYGPEEGIRQTLAVPMDTLSSWWIKALKQEFGPDLTGREKKVTGKRILSEENAGYMNIAPSISPNGRYLVFLSEKDLFSTELYLADARTGKIIRKLTSSVRHGHIDDLNFMESSGTWSPHSNMFAYVIYAKGSNRLVIQDVKTGKIKKEVKLKGVPAFSNPAWSPDGRTIVVAGLVEGQIDLYAYDVKTGKVTQLTDDTYDEVLPAWSPDGKKLVFASDKWSRQNGRMKGRWTHSITVMDVATGQKSTLPLFHGADNLNPLFTPDGDILFLSDRDGYRNLYRFNIGAGKLYQLTDYAVGITGITPYAPAIDIDRKRNRLIYNTFGDSKYRIYSAKLAAFEPKEVAWDAVDLRPARLFEPAANSLQVSEKEMEAFDDFVPLDSTQIVPVKFRSKFRLDYLAGSTGVGVGTGNFGTSTALAGGIQMLFSDILGRHQISGVVALNGDVQDFGMMGIYVNQVNKISWGLNLQHIPYRSGRYYSPVIDTLVTADGIKIPAFRYSLDIRRLFENRLGAFVFYPFSTVLRVEAGVAYNRYGYSLTRYSTYTDLNGFELTSTRERLPAPDGFNLYNGNTALVGDNSFFGLTAPLKGYRFRFGGEVNFGGFKFNTLTLDYRHYFRFKPVTLALRAMHFGRYGRDHALLYPIFLGYPTLVRGIEQIERETINQVIGSKVLLGNVELRLPFTGPKRLALIPSRFLLTDLNVFLDNGVAYFERSDFELPAGLRPLLVQTAGVSLRVNLFGALVIEPYYAWPVGGEQRRFTRSFGINFAPGW